MTTIEQFSTTDALIAQSQANRAALAALNESIETSLRYPVSDLIAENNALRAALGGAMADMYEAMCTLQGVVEQSRKIHPCPMCDD